MRNPGVFAPSSSENATDPSDSTESTNEINQPQTSQPTTGTTPTIPEDITPRGYAPPSGGTKRPCRDRYLSKLLQLAIAIRLDIFQPQNTPILTQMSCFSIILLFISLRGGCFSISRLYFVQAHRQYTPSQIRQGQATKADGDATRWGILVCDLKGEHRGFCFSSKRGGGFCADD